MTAIRVTSGIRHATRRLVRARGFAFATILTLALGIGTVASAFSVVNAVLLRPLPYREPERLVSLSHTLDLGRMLHVDQSDASLLFYGRHARSFTAFGGYRVAAAALAPVNGADAERVAAALVTGGVLSALGVPPVRGRVLTEADTAHGAPPVLVLADRLWDRKFGRDPRVLNRSLHVDGVAHEVVGVMPDHVRFPSADTEVWLPLRLDPAKTDSATFDYQAIARLRDEVTIGSAESELSALLLRLPREFPGRLTPQAVEQTRMRALVRPLDQVVVGDVGRLLWIALGAAFFVLAIAATNVANLFLVRGEARRNSIVVERALGASTTELVLQFAWEGLLVAALAAALGGALTSAGLAALQSFGPVIDLPRLTEVRLDFAVFLVAAGAALAASLLASGIPALGIVLRSASAGVDWTGRASTADRFRFHSREALIVVQVALALVLLVGSGLMARSVWKIRDVRPGFEPANAMTFRLALPAATYATPDESVLFYHRLVDEIRTLPSVAQAAVVSKLPLDPQAGTDTAVFIEGRPIPPGSLPGIHPVVYATPGYFEAAGIRIISGRTFTPSEPPRAVHEVVVSQALAQRYWPNETPVGKRLRILINGPWYTIVGLAGDVRNTALDRPDDEVLYCPLLPAREDPRWAPRDLAVIVRVAGPSLETTGAIRDLVRGLDGSLPMYRIRPFSHVVRQAYARREVTFVLIVGAAAVAIVLGGVGLFGVMSHVMALRTREIAIRLALGARPTAVRRMVAFQGLRVAAIGIAIGIAGATILTRSLSTLLYEVSPTDPAVLGTGAVMVLLAAAAVSWIPTRRTTKIDPATALRAE